MSPPGLPTEHPHTFLGDGPWPSPPSHFPPRAISVSLTASIITSGLVTPTQKCFLGTGPLSDTNRRLLNFPKCTAKSAYAEGTTISPPPLPEPILLSSKSGVWQNYSPQAKSSPPPVWPTMFFIFLNAGGEKIKRLIS